MIIAKVWRDDRHSGWYRETTWCLLRTAHGNSSKEAGLKSTNISRKGMHTIPCTDEHWRGKGEEDEGGRKRDIKLRVEGVGEGRERERERREGGREGRKAVLLMEPLSGLAALGDLQLKSPRSLRNPHPWFAANLLMRPSVCGTALSLHHSIGGRSWWTILRKY